MSPSTPSWVEKPAPKESSPVDFSTTLVLITTWSGALPCSVRDVDRLEEAEIAQPLLRAAQQGGVERVALGEPELAPDHLVQGAQVAADVDALDIDPLALVDLVGDVDRERLGILGQLRLDVDEGVAQPADLVGQRLDRRLDLVGVVDRRPCMVSARPLSCSVPRSLSVVSTLISPNLYCGPSSSVKVMKNSLPSGVSSATAETTWKSA